MQSAAEIVAAAMPELKSWIGRKELIEDEVPITTVRRVAAMLDVEPEGFDKGSALPRQWFSLFFASNAMQKDIGPDGHPNKGLFLPPIPLPRRMAAGRRVVMSGSLVAGQPATRTAEVLAIEPKAGRTGQMVVLTMRHTYETGGKTIATEEFDAVYREALAPGERNKAPEPVAPPERAAWSHTVELASSLVFRYSAITWNAHRIHYDADYTRGTEGYAGVVQNGGLTLQLIVDAAVRRLPGAITGFEARLMRPLWVGDTLRIEGEAPRNGRLACWGVDKDGAIAAKVTVSHA